MPSKAQKSPVFNSDKELSDFLLSNLTDSLKQSIKITVTLMVKSEMENLRKEVNEKLSFNGYYDRNMTSTLGKIQGIQIPRWRESSVLTQNLRSFSVFDQEKERFLQLVAEMHRLGVSTRKVDQICRNVFGLKMNKNQVSEVHAELAREESLQINQQPIAEEFEYLLLDGLWVKAKHFGLKTSNKIVLLCALGIKADQTRKILGFTPADNESYESWHEFVLGLKQRGLNAGALKLAITDGAEGLISTLDHLLPAVKQQSCLIHKMRNVFKHTKYRNRKAVSADVKVIYQAETRKQAIDRMKAFAKKWYVAEPVAVENLRLNFERTLTYLEFPKELWSKLRTNNVLEREFREVRRRIKVFDSSFNSTESLNRYGNSIFDNLNHHYPASLTH